MSIPATQWKPRKPPGSTVFVVHEGERISLTQLAQRTGLSYQTLLNRHRRGKVGADLTQPTAHTMQLRTDLQQLTEEKATRIMWLATMRPGTAHPFVTEVDGTEVVVDAQGNAQRRPRKPYARKIAGGGAAALSQTPAGAIASCRCVFEQSEIERELLSKRDRA